LSCKYDMIVSNPPYISRQEFEHLPGEVKDYEPYISLNGGEDGLQFYHRVFQVSNQLLKESGIIGLEISYGKGDEITKLFQSYHFKDVEVFNDLNRIERVIIGKKS